MSGTKGRKLPTSADVSEHQKVERYAFYGDDGEANPVENPGGGWVDYDDCKALAARVQELKHRIDELESMWPDQSRLTAENTCLAARVQELEDGYVKCVVNRAELQIENTRLREALEKIRDQDYRGNRPWSATVAYDALEEKS